jgi:hypothetical protein
MDPLSHSVWFNGTPLPSAYRGLVLVPWAESGDVLV